MNKKSQHWTLLAAFLIVSLLLPACGAAPAQASTIKIGAALCLTGIQAPLDEPALKGAQVAVDEINKKGGVLGKQLELINLDCKSDPVTTGNVAVQLIDQGAEAIIAPSDFDFGGPASREAQKAGLVGISPAASSPFYGSKALGDRQFTMSMWNTTMGAAAAQYAQEQGWKTAYVVTDDFIQYTKDLGRWGWHDPVPGEIYAGRRRFLCSACTYEGLARAT
jgi:branched-chain amino acid transport system substrate-binding protein